MKKTSLRWMVPVMVGLALLRGWDWWKSAHQDSTAAAELSTAVTGPASEHAPLAASVSALRPLVAVVANDAEVSAPADEAVPNVFAIRVPPTPPAPPVPAAPPPPKPFVGPPIPPPPPPPPPPPSIQVIGTWQDASGLSVFVSNTSETAQARLGDVLFGQYRVTQLSADRIVIHDPSRKSDFTYPVPRVDPHMNPPPHP
jgi:hypothetical protein